METKHLRGLDQDLSRGKKEGGGSSDALKRVCKRPESNYHANARHSVDMDKFRMGYDIIFNKKKKKI